MSNKTVNSSRTTYKKSKHSAPVKDHIPKTKNSSHTKSLEEKLNQIYYGEINIDTICKGNLTCCKTACPQMNYSEFSSLITKIWSSSSKSEKIEMVYKSIEYFFKTQFEQFGLEIFHKPCLLLGVDGKCKWYQNRCLNCRLYGLWDNEVYRARVDKFEKAYYELGVKREDLPLNTQCSNVKRIDDSIPLTIEIIDRLFYKLNALDKIIGHYSDKQIEQKYNYRTFHDWLLLKVFGEQFLSDLTSFILSGNKKIIEDQIDQFKMAIKNKFSKDDIKLDLL